MNWVLVLYFVTKFGVGSVTVEGLSYQGCKDQALKYMNTQNLDVLALCVEKR